MTDMCSSTSRVGESVPMMMTSGSSAATRSGSASAAGGAVDDVVARGLQAFLEQTDFLLGVVHQHDAEHPVGCSR